MSKTLLSQFAVLLFISTTTCFGWSDNAQLDKKIQAQRPASTPEAIRDRAAETFSNAPGLNADQKIRIKKVYLNTYDSAKEFAMKIGKAKSLLFMTIAEKEYSAKEVEQIKAKIVELDSNRLNLMFAALDEVQEIVGLGNDRKDLYEHLLDYDKTSHIGMIKNEQQP